MKIFNFSDTIEHKAHEKVEYNYFSYSIKMKNSQI